MKLLSTQLKEVARWTLTATEFDAIAGGLMKSARHARQGIVAASAKPTVEHYRAWRRRVTDQWFQVRFLEDRCRNRLRNDERHPEVLDGYLGEYHNCVLLERILTAEPHFPAETAVPVRNVLRRYQRKLRRQALAEGRYVYAEIPRQLVARVEMAWRLPSEQDRPRGAWPRSLGLQTTGRVPNARAVGERRASWSRAA